MTKQMKCTCEECGSVKSVRAMYKWEVFDTPWDESPRVIYLCKNMPKSLKKEYNYQWRESCEELLTDSSWADFRYFECANCYRMVCEQNPRNGWHSQVRYINCKSYCLKCYEEILLENGVEREEFENNKLPGMFLDDSELADVGYTKVLDYVSIRSTEDAKRVCTKALELIDSGHKVIVGYESMAIGGLDGYISLFAKSAETD